jgi:hypothetical protein
MATYSSIVLFITNREKRRVNKEERKRLRLGCVQDGLSKTEQLILGGASDDDIIQEAMCETHCITGAIYLVVREKVPCLAILIARTVPKEVLEDLEAVHLGEMSNLVFKYGNKDEVREFSIFLKYTTPILSLKFLRSVNAKLLPKDVFSSLAATIIESGTAEEIRSTILHYEDGSLTLPDGAYEMLQSKAKAVA